MSLAKTYCTAQLGDLERAAKMHSTLGEMRAVNKYLVDVSENLAFRRWMRLLEFLDLFLFHLFSIHVHP